MNLSGESVGLLARYYKVEPENVLVLYDDISLDVGFIRVRPKGSSGGHNGIKNLIAHLGTEVFPRVRVGVGNKPAGWDLADYVLGHFTKEEQPKLVEAMDMAVDACQTILVTGIDEAMNQYNSHKR
jgi:PTH1 family peptidyl-tRNA hydrolase